MRLDHIIERIDCVRDYGKHLLRNLLIATRRIEPALGYIPSELSCCLMLVIEQRGKVSRSGATLEAGTDRLTILACRNHLIPYRTQQ